MTYVNLKGNLEKEYNDPYTNKKIFNEYYKGGYIQEFIELPEIVYKEWSYWKNEYNRRLFEEVERDSFDEYFLAFKDYWQYNTSETQQVFKEMKLLSDSMIREWREKYTFSSAYEYEGYESYIKSDYLSKSKVQLWEEFKKFWKLVPENYSEYKFEQYLKFIHKCETNYKNYSKNYPRNFWEYRENANYHSFDSYSVLKQYNVCREWEENR